MKSIGVGIRGTLPKTQIEELKPGELLIPHFVGPPCPFVVEVRPILVPLGIPLTEENLIRVGCDVFFFVDVIAEGEAYDVSLRVMNTKIVSRGKSEWLFARQGETVIWTRRLEQSPSWPKLIAILAFAFSRMEEKEFINWQVLCAQQRVLAVGSG